MTEFTKRGSELLYELRSKAAEISPICQTAPIIWDGDTPEDVRMAKMNCKGRPADSEHVEIPRCPLLNLCLETALENKEQYGIWGGMTPYERRKFKIRKKT